MEKTILNVPSMSCGHCKGRIEKALNEANIEGTVNLDNKTVEVNEAKVNEARKIIDEAGYPVEK